ncbi:MAG: mechanosensitive ion channel [Bacteroidaceae bacterium]|nr:mechanosensitive ion channel [Bacteroidaceae bacterium]
MSLYLLQAAEEVVNIADSLKTTTDRAIMAFKDDPNVFFRDLGNDALQFAVKVVAALLIYILGIWIIRTVKRILRRSFERKKTEQTVATFVSSLVSISLTVLLIIITISTLGVNTTSLAAVLAAGGMAVGMALSGTVQNFAGGIMILIFKPFKVGDFITSNGVSGTVTAVSMVSTQIRTVDNRIIFIPNGDLSNSTVDNYSVNSLRRVDWVVNVEYGSDADACIALLTKILKSDERVLDASTEGAADLQVLLSSLNDKDISFAVRAWTKSENYWNLFFDINLRIYKELPMNGFYFAYPQMNVTISQKE